MAKPADISVAGVRCESCNRKGRTTGTNDWTCQHCGATNPASVEKTNRPEAVNLNHLRVGEGLTRDMNPACYNSPTPEIWFSDEPPGRGMNRNERIAKAKSALLICAECPIQQACLKYAMTDADAVLHGIWGGTFAFERAIKEYKGASLRSAFKWQGELRKLFQKEGLLCPPIPQDLQAATIDSVTKRRRKKVQELTEQGKLPREIADILGEPVTLIRGDRNAILRRKSVRLS